MPITVAPGRLSGRSSGVEHNLAKVRVARSIRVARSNFLRYSSYLGSLNSHIEAIERNCHTRVTVSIVMANIRKRGTRWQAQIRRQGQQAKTATFHTRHDVVRWARAVERQFDVGDIVPISKNLETLTLGELVERYLSEVVPQKKSALNETPPPQDNPFASLTDYLRFPGCCRA